MAIFINRLRTAHPPKHAHPRAAVVLDTPNESPTYERHHDPFAALHQEAFFSAAMDHDRRKIRFARQHRSRRALLHDVIAKLLRAYAHPSEIGGLHFLRKPGPACLEHSSRVHPAMIGFLEGAAEEFFSLYLADHYGGYSIDTADATLLTQFHHANFHAIYNARLLEFATYISTSQPSHRIAALERRYGPNET